MATSAGARTEIQVPDIGEPADLVMSPREEAELGRDVMRQLLTHGFVLEDPLLRDYIQSLGEHLLSHTEPGGTEFHFFVVRDSGINAFALPGGYIGMNAGLITASQTESELAGVMAHEIAHVTQRHIARQINKTQGWNLATAALMVAAIIAGSQDPELAQAALGIGLGAAQQAQINFTRSHEKEADRLGIGTLADAGFNPQGMADFFHRLSQKSQLYGQNIPELLRTHPVSSNRIAEAQQRAASLPAHQPDSSLDYRLMRERARLLMSRLDSEALTYYRAVTRFDSSLEQKYGLALALGRNRAYDEALELISELRRQESHPALDLAQARLLESAGQRKQAVAALKQSHKRFADSRAVTLTYAEMLLATGQPREARQLLLESDLILHGDWEAHRLLSLAARDMDRTAEALFQLAAHDRARGNYVSAVRQLRNALRLEDLSERETERIEARLEQYLKEAPESEVRRSQQEEPVNRRELRPQRP